MPNTFIPTYIFDSIYEITPDLLKKRQVAGILIDLDGTMASRHDALPPEGLHGFLQGFLKAGIGVLVLSNNNESRVSRFCEELGVPHVSNAAKPFARGFRKGAAQLGVPLEKCAVIGDQIFTDTFGGNRLGTAATCFVRSLDLGDFWIGLRNQLEKPFIHAGKKRMKKNS